LGEVRLILPKLEKLGDVSLSGLEGLDEDLPYPDRVRVSLLLHDEHALEFLSLCELRQDESLHGVPGVVRYT